MATRMLQRRGTAAEWAAANPILGDGEIGIERNTGIVKVGDGTTAWASLVNVYKRASEYVARAGDTMTGPLRIERANGGLDAIQLRNADSGLMFYLRTRVGGGMEFVNNAYSAVVASISDAGALVANTLTGTNGVYDGANRVYSAGNVPPYPNAFAVIDAVGDILVGTGDNAAGRLAKGANNSIMVVNSAGTVTWLVKGSNGQVLTIDGSGNLSWATPAAADLSTRVAKAGDTMTSTLVISPTTDTEAIVLRRGLAGQGNDIVNVRTETGSTLTRITNTGAVYAPSVFDGGNRVYSASNPPPVSGMSVLGGIGIGSPTTGPTYSPGYNDFGSSYTFVAPANGKVTHKISVTGWAGVGLSVGVRITALHSAGTALPEQTVGVSKFYNNSSGGANPSVFGEVMSSGLTPGTTYTVQPIFRTDSSYAGGTPQPMLSTVSSLVASAAFITEG